MIIHEMKQGSEEWHLIKCGKISASSMSDVLAKGKGVTRRNYMLRLLAERLSGIPQETYSNGAMQWGIETEPMARMAYEASTLTVVDQVGFIEVNEFLGCSPDGLVCDDGGCELKCPFTSTHLNYILEEKSLLNDYFCQVQSTLWMTKRKWWDLSSFDPRVPSHPLHTVRVERDESYIDLISHGVDTFIAEMLELENKIKGV